MVFVKSPYTVRNKMMRVWPPKLWTTSDDIDDGSWSILWGAIVGQRGLSSIPGTIASLLHKDHLPAAKHEEVIKTQSIALS